MASDIISEKSIKEEIIALSKILDEKKHELFLGRLINMNLKKLQNNSKDFAITVYPETHEWNISYTHETSKYDMSLYIPDHEINSDVSDSEPIEKKSNISFGKSGKRYFIKGGIKFNIYRNSTGELRVMNPEYDFDIDMEEHKHLIHKYSENSNIPEACALAVFQFMIDNKWDDTAIINYLSIV